MTRKDYEEWGPWRTSGMPELGDCVQVEGRDKFTLKKAKKEGFVVEICPETGRCKLSSDDDVTLLTERWRKRIQPTGQEETGN